LGTPVAKNRGGDCESIVLLAPIEKGGGILNTFTASVVRLICRTVDYVLSLNPHLYDGGEKWYSIRSLILEVSRKNA
jgi:hypothetical protein